MKRSAETEGFAGNGKETAVKAFRRQNPVSCQFCRSKKLRCDRAQPCANCFARHISCVPASGSAESPAQVQALARVPVVQDNQWSVTYSYIQCGSVDRPGEDLIRISGFQGADISFLLLVI